MKLSSLFFCVVLALSSSAMTTADARGVVECNLCQSPKDAAIASGVGMTIVVDLEMRAIKAYNVEYDREMRKYRAVPQPVPPSIAASFNRYMDALDRRLKNARDGDEGGPIFSLDPDSSVFVNGISFPEDYRDSDAFQIVQQHTSRTRLGAHLAAQIAGAYTSSEWVNALAFSVHQVILNFLSKVAFGSVSIVITWRDGSTTVYRMDKNSDKEAEYVPGKSRDRNGNKVPDQAITDPATAPSYVGSYQFASSDDLNSWLDSARMYGVQISGGSSGGDRMHCSWDGGTLFCLLQ